MIRGNLSAQAIQEFSPTRKELSIQATADNSPIRIIYGETVVPGDVFAYGIDTGDLVVGVAWGYGELEAITKVYINDELITAGVTHYLGTTTQTVDTDLQAAIAAFDDDMVLRTPRGSVGIAYTVFRISSGDISGAPRFQAVVQGLKVDDPRPSKDPLFDDVELWAVFDKAEPVDLSLGTRTVTLETGVQVVDRFVTNSATNQGVKFSGGFAFGTQDFRIDAKIKILDPFGSGIFDIYRGNYAAGVDAITWRVNADKVEIIVKDGATQEFYEANAYTIPQGVVELDMALSRESGVFYLDVEGEQEWSFTATANINTTSSENRTCYSESNPPRLNAVRSLRIRLGSSGRDGSYEPRGLPFADCRRYSDNSALCFADLATHDIYGMGAELSGYFAIADWNDTLLNGLVPRCRLSIVLTRPNRTISYLDLLATYAEIIYYWNGAVLEAIPDAAVDLATVDTEDNCVAGTLSVEGVDDDDTPNKVYAAYTESSTSSGYWAEATAVQSLPGVDEGEIPAVETRLQLPGITRAEEAANKAQSRVARMANRVRVSWTTTDKAIQWKKGTVVRHQMPTRGTDLYARITNVTMTDYARYRVSAMRYDASHYPSEVDVPTTTGSVPVGAILPLLGDTIPAGWASFNDANGKFIVCAGGIYSEGDTGGSSTFSGFIGSTSAEKSHPESSQYVSFKLISRISGPNFGFRSDAGPPDPDTAHSHTFSTGAFTPDLLRREHRLVIKTGTTSSTIPASIRVMGLGNVQLGGLNRVVSESNRLLMAAASGALAGDTSQFVALTTGSTSNSHDHVGESDFGIQEGPLQTQDTAYTQESTAGQHTHRFSLPIVVSPKAVNVPLYASAEDYQVIPGMIVLWEGGTLPAGWVLCDGTGATPDLTDHFIRISPEGSEFDKAGDNTLSAAGSSTSVGHGHRGESLGLSGTYKESFDHSNQITHQHTISEAGAYTPPYYALSAIMFSP